MATSWLEINARHLRQNLQQFHHLAPQAELWPVVKSNAYGHGLKEVATIIADSKLVSGFMVVNLLEALELKGLTTKPIMVLSYFELEEESVKQALLAGILLPIYDLASAKFLNNLATQLQIKAKVNIKIDTGTGRLGLRPDLVEEFIKEIKNLDHLEIFSLYSHLAESEGEELSFSRQQWQALAALSQKFPEFKKHIACSAATISLPEAQADIIRLGLSLYGLWPSETTKRRGQSQGINLLPVLAWRTRVIQVKKILAGASVGYNRTWQAEQDCQIVTLPVGYYEGYDRSLSNRAQVLIKGQRCSVRGNICMNLMMVEVPLELELVKGEVVTLIGSDDQDTISCEELATLAGTINYEIVARLNSNLAKQIIN